MISAACDSNEAASAVSSLITLPAILFGGLFVNNSTVFKELSWIQWLSPVRYGFECLAIAEYKPRGLEEFYQEGLGFGTKLNFWGCIGLLFLLTILSRIASIVVLQLNIKKFQWFLKSNVLSYLNIHKHNYLQDHSSRLPAASSSRSC